MAASDPSRHFSRTYAEAREKFLAAAAPAGRVRSYPHPLPGPEGEALAVDVLLDGAADAERLLVVSSGCHGIEGFGGAGIQLALLDDAAIRTQAQRTGIALLFVHALNPYGFAWARRTTEDNVDLNRNFVDFTRPLPANPAYDEIAGLLVPEHWPPGWGNRLALLSFIARRGRRAMQAAVSAGQYTHPDGLFFGGQRPTWSHVTLREVLRTYGAGRRRIGWIDLHTGLGPSGHGERIYAGDPEPAALARARRWWGIGVTSMQAGESASVVVTGPAWRAAEECPQAEYTGIGLEFGTLPLLRVIDALRADQWLALHPDAPPAQRRQIKAQLRAAFCVDTPAWRAQLVEQTRQAVQEALRGLAV
ncbi:MAG TPA: M14 family metallopeptidase [Burkholderiaceae bacterium]|nr:M14 family metallopeptidase [Burkholderiaceae bacterium]